MTSAVITLALAVVVLGTGLVLALRYAVKANEGAGDARELLVAERIEHEAAKSEVARQKFEILETMAALLAAEQTIARLGSAVEKKLDEPVNGDLAPSDVDARRLRAAIKAKASAARAGGPLPADEDAAVHSETATGGSVRAEVHPAGSLDPDEVLR